MIKRFVIMDKVKKIATGGCIAAMMFLIACGYSDPLIFETRELDFNNKTGNVVNGEILNLDVAGGISIEVYDTLLMVIANNPDAHLQVFDKRTLEPLARLCQQGHAKNEFSDKNIFKSDQTYVRNGDLIMILRGEGGNVLKEINVSESLRSGHTVVESINTNIPFHGGKVFVLDNNIKKTASITNSIEVGTYTPPYLKINDENNNTEIDIYRRLVDFEDDIYSNFWYTGCICKHPTKNIIVQCMSTIDYIHFFDLENDKYHSVHQVGTPTFKSIHIPYNVVDGSYQLDGKHFNEIATSEDFFLVLYFAGDYCTKEHSNGNYEASELLAFDWQGNYLGGVKLDMFAQDLSYDSKACTLYGFRMREEKIVKFDLTDFIREIQQ